LFYITGGAPQAVPGTACVEANQTACTEVCCSSGTVVSLPRRVPCSLVPPRRRGAHGQVRHVALSAPKPFPKPLEPGRGHPTRLQRDFAAGRAAPPHPCPITGLWISGVRLRSGGLDLIRPDLISTVRCRFSSSARSPHPRPCRWARPISPSPGC
jgi:hypothetical protein